MFEWIAKYMEQFKCDFDTAAREYHLYKHPETYNADDYDDPDGYHPENQNNYNDEYLD